MRLPIILLIFYFVAFWDFNFVQKAEATSYSYTSFGCNRDKGSCAMEYHIGSSADGGTVTSVDCLSSFCTRAIVYVKKVVLDQNVYNMWNGTLCGTILSGSHNPVDIQSWNYGNSNCYRLTP